MRLTDVDAPQKATLLTKQRVHIVVADIQVLQVMQMTIRGQRCQALKDTASVRWNDRLEYKGPSPIGRHR